MKFTTIYSTFGRIVLGIIALRYLPSVEAQTADGFGVCLPGWEWSYNSGGQNPCEIAGSLQAPCLGYSVYVLGPIGQGSEFVTPQTGDTLGLKCGCNTVIYSLYEACERCQWPPNATSHNWVFWAQFCDTVYIGQYPFPIPSNASVPHWAYLNDTAGDGFDPVLAQAAGRDPEATPAIPSTTSLPSTSSSTHSLPTSITNTPTPGTGTPPAPSAGGGNDNSKTHNVGAVAGAVVGGVLGLAIIATLALFLLRRRGERAGANNILEPNQVVYNPTMVESKYRQPKLYNPSDPSTFPSPAPGGDSSLSGGYATNPFQSGGYTGAAEPQGIA